MTETRALGERAAAMIDALAAITAEPGKLTRLYLTPEHKRAALLVGEWMERAGLTVRMDAAGTMHGLRPAGRDGPHEGQRLLVGSHIDTVVDAGRFDGNLGVVVGILAAEELHRRGIALPFGLEVLAFGDEEGVRFPKTLTSSSAIAGSVDASLLDMADANGVTLRQALTDFGCEPDRLTAEAYRREDVLGYLEVHIEQGPVLEQAGEALGVVTAIASQARGRIHVTGMAGHAGTVPMAMRRDALAGAAEIISAVEEVARKGVAASLVATVGELRVSPGASNVIPGSVEFSLDVRAADDASRKGATTDIETRAKAIAARRNLTVAVDIMHQKPVTAASATIAAAITAGIANVTQSQPRRLMSGAGHDGQAMIQLTEIGMIFVRCRAGISHNPLEYVTNDDMGVAVEALVQTIIKLAGDDSA
jgi:allantoate deiminase